MPQKPELLPKLQEDEILVDEQGWIYPSRKWREDDAEFALVSNPNIKIVVPMGISLENAYMGIKNLKPSEQLVQVELDFVANRLFFGHLIVRMNPKARLHIVVNC